MPGLPESAAGAASWVPGPPSGGGWFLGCAVVTSFSAVFFSFVTLTLRCRNQSLNVRLSHLILSWSELRASKSGADFNPKCTNIYRVPILSQALR